MALYDRQLHLEDEQDDEYGVEPGLSASVPEEGSPLRNGVRPNITRQRSSSTQLSRPKLPAWQYEGSVRGRNPIGIDDDAQDAWDRSTSGSPPPRPSIESAYSSRSSASPANQSNSASSPDPDLAPRKSFKRSITVPTRPRIPGTWGDAPTSAPISGSNEYEVRVP